LENLLRDFLHGLRVARRTPLVTAVVVVTLALGVGAATAISSVANAVLIHPLGPVNSDRLVILYATDTVGRTNYPAQGDVADWKASARSFEAIETWRGQSFLISGGDEPANVYGHRVSAGFFDLVGLRIARGRTFVTSDYEPGSPHVTVLSHRTWTSRFASDPNIVGRSVLFGKNAFTIIGVTAPGDFQLFSSMRPELWVPLILGPGETKTRRAQALGALARLKRGVPLRQAQSEMDVIAAGLARQYPETNQGRGCGVKVAADDLVSDIRPLLLILLGAAGCVLLIACANVATLLVARASTRAREMAIRSSLGAARRRIMSQVLIESLAIGIVGGVLGILLGFWSLRPLVTLVPDRVTVPGFGNIRVDMSVLGFSLGLSVVTALIFGLLPAWQASRTNPNAHLQEEGRGGGASPRSRAVGNALVVAEFMFALVLLTGAALLIRTLNNVSRIDPGFVSDNLYTMSVDIPPSRYKPEQGIAFFQEIRARIAAMPGITSAALTSVVPLTQDEPPVPLQMDGGPAPASGAEPTANPNLVSDGFFSTMRMPLRAGRDFSPQDVPGSPWVVIINDAMARRYWPGSDPVGRVIRVPFLFRNGEVPPPVTIVGVVGGARMKSLASEPEPDMYFPYAQHPRPFASFAVRTAGDPRQIGGQIRAAVWTVDKTQPVSPGLSMKEIIADSVWHLRFVMTLLTIFGALGLVMAATGVYAVVSYSVRQRTHEIGVRMAMGAHPRQVVGMIAVYGLRLAAIGVCAALIGAFALDWLLAHALQTNAAATSINRWLPIGQQQMLYGMRATDPLTFGVLAILLVAVAGAASYFPARRAAQVDPLRAIGQP
jgi:putative ABC transport system permease protein